MGEKTFRQFVEEGFVKSVEDNLGIKPEDMEHEPQIGKFYAGIGPGTNLGSYKIVRTIRNQKGEATHMVVRPISRDKTYKDEKGKWSQLEDGKEESGREMTFSIKDMQKIMQQDFEPPPAAPQ
jgi:hypothetical protein